MLRRTPSYNLSLVIVFKSGFRMPQAPQNVTQLLIGWSNGDKQALDALVPLVYDELRRQASRYLRRERMGHTLQTTALIHEAYLRLVDQRNVHWQNRAHFFGIAAQLMRRILVDHARTKKRAKRGGSDVRISLSEATLKSPAQNLDIDRETRLEHGEGLVTSRNQWRSY